MNKSYESLQQLVEIDSPTGYTHHAEAFVMTYLSNKGLYPKQTHKGAVKLSFGEHPTIALAAHLDTLGAIVSGIKPNGTLTISPIGGLGLISFEGGYVRIRTMNDKVFTGTFLLNNPASHANKATDSAQRSIETMHIRLDEEVNTKEACEKLGIRVGDFVCFDTRYEELSSGYIKSRFMDNKASCYVLFRLAEHLAERNISIPVEFFFSNYEEVGHGGSGGYAETVKDLLVLDMGVVGDQCEGSETHCSICAKDSTGPYDYALRKELTELAIKHEIPHKIDIYPFYGSDGSAALRAGNDFRVGLIGPGVSASHGVERTHKKGIEATIELCLAFLRNRFPEAGI
ncbi:MAG: M42 family metallopeptidase [Candidatus Kapaibacteriota bacterium]